MTIPLYVDVAPGQPSRSAAPVAPEHSVASHFTADRAAEQCEPQPQEAPFTPPPPPPPHDSSLFEALYLHVPFCFHKCHYCDFYSVVNSDRTDEGRQAQFTDALLRELHFWAQDTAMLSGCGAAAHLNDSDMGRCAAPAKRGRTGTLRPRTIFIGGGTPTLLRVEHWKRLLDALHQRGVMRSVTEFTVEANPETVTPELMRTLVAGGVNRISIGAQTFEPDLLRALERWHDPASVPRAVATVRNAGIDNINLDLIFAIPAQTSAMFDADLDAALALEPEHVSLYALTFEPNTPLGKRWELGRVTPMEEGLNAALYGRAMERMEREGFEHYEVSAWCRPPHPHAPPSPTRRCEHNLIYWRGGNWLGLGPSAASGLGPHRWKNRGHLSAYAADSPQPPRSEDETLDVDARFAERLMMGLRLRDGLDRGWLDPLTPPDSDRYASLEAMIDLGFIERDDRRVRLTPRGLMVADSVIAELL